MTHLPLFQRVRASLSFFALLALGTGSACAQSEASAVLSLMPLASVVAVTGGASVAVGAAVALPVALSVSGAVLTVRAVQSTARGSLILLERASDGAQVSLQLAGQVGARAAYSIGTGVVCSVIGTGVLLSVAGELLAFVPNALGRALLHDERVL